MAWLRTIRTKSGFTLLEVLITLVLVGILGAVAAFTFSAMLQKDNLQKATEMLKEDIMGMRSRAASVLRTQRILLLSNTSYVTQEYDPVGATWNYVSLVRYLPNDIIIRAYDFANKSTSLEFLSNGLPNFNGQAATPFFTLVNSITDDRKGIFIETAGAIYLGAGAADVS